jgi:hypothetical protein
VGRLESNVRTHRTTQGLKAYDSPILIKQTIEEKRRFVRDWQRLLTPERQRILITATQELEGFIPTESTDYSLRKATKKTKPGEETSPPLRTSQGIWARSNVEKVHAFTEHLAHVFHPHPSENEPEEEQALIQLLEALTNSNHQSNVSKEQKFKKSSTA